MWRSLLTAFDRLGLQRRIMLYVSVGLTAFSAVFAFVAFQAIQQSTDLVFRERLLVARTIAHEIDDDLERVEQEIQDTSGVVARALAQNSLPHIDGALRALCAHWFSNTSASGACLLWITDANGLVLRSFPPELRDLPVDLTGRLGAVQESESQSFTLSNGRMPGESAPSAVVFVDPLLGGSGRVGFLVGEIDRAGLKSRLEPSLQAVQGRYAVEVIDDHGMVVTTNGLGEQHSPSQHIDIVGSAWRDGQAGIRNHVTTVKGVEQSHVIAFAPLSRIRWGIVVEQEEDEALALPQQLQIRFIGLALLALVGGLALAWVTTNAVVRPVSELIQATQEIAQGDLDHPLAASGGDEVGTLARRFEQMRVALHKSLEEIAAWNRDLENRVQARTRELAALVESSHALAQTLDLDTLFEILMKQTHTLLPSAQGAIFFLYHPETNDLRACAAAGLAAKESELVLGLDEAITGQVFHLRIPVRLPTRSLVDEMLASCSDAHRVVFRRALGDQPILSALGVPVLSKQDCLGVLTLYNYSQESAFTDDSVSVVGALANQAATAIENARLYREAGEVGALRELDRLKSEFVARASHELRTPMTAIKSLTESLLRPDLQLDLETRQEFLRGIDSAADRLDAIVDQLLTLSRIDAGQLGIRRDPVSVGAVVQEVVKEVRAQIPTRVVEVDIDRALPRVLGDRERLEDVLRNLLSNALKYSTPDSSVRLSAAQMNGSVVMAVADQGIGIPPEERARIFERFYRVDNALTRRVGGAGLGLYLCKTYVEAMGGSIAVEDIDGRGSLFKITLAAENVPG